MAKERGEAYEEDLDGRNLKILIAVSRFNRPITQSMRDRCVNRLIELGVPEHSIIVVEVPGALELPAILQHGWKSHRPQSAIALGAVVRGETDHYEHVARTCIEGIQRVSLEASVPIVMGVLTTDTEKQARARAKQAATYAENAVEMANLVKSPGGWPSAANLG